jgi:hypothetical protein
LVRAIGILEAQEKNLVLKKILQKFLIDLKA